LPIDRMIKKAYDLMQKRRVEPLGEGLYNVVGDHGTYTVAQRINGTVNCSCPGFVRRRRCSHSLAVLMLSRPSLLTTVEKEIRKAAERRESEPVQR
jgi:hypothetical protein